jgi:hypothetical protein
MEGRREERRNRAGDGDKAIKIARRIGGEVGVGDGDPSPRGDVTNPQFPFQEKGSARSPYNTLAEPDRSRP